MPGVNFALVREQISMADVLRLLRFEPISVRGDQHRGPCPVHESSDPQSRSFSVNIRLGRYNCFGCGSSGNALELWATVRRLTLHAASIELCELLGIDAPWITR
jgi:DNA primase